jgi:hypothetical protein
MGRLFVPTTGICVFRSASRRLPGFWGGSGTPIRRLQMDQPPFRRDMGEGSGFGPLPDSIVTCTSTPLRSSSPHHCPSPPRSPTIAPRIQRGGSSAQSYHGCIGSDPFPQKRASSSDGSGRFSSCSPDLVARRTRWSNTVVQVCLVPWRSTWVPCVRATSTTEGEGDDAGARPASVSNLAGGLAAVASANEDSCPDGDSLFRLWLPMTVCSNQT